MVCKIRVAVAVWQSGSRSWRLLPGGVFVQRRILPRNGDHTAVVPSSRTERHCLSSVTQAKAVCLVDDRKESQGNSHQGSGNARPSSPLLPAHMIIAAWLYIPSTSEIGLYTS